MSLLAHQKPLSKGRREIKSSVCKLASYSQYLTSFVVRKCRNQCIKVLKYLGNTVSNFYKNGYKEYKISPRELGASKVPAAAGFLSSPVCLPSCPAERRGHGGERPVYAQGILGTRVFWCNGKMHAKHKLVTFCCQHLLRSSRTVPSVAFYIIQGE